MEILKFQKPELPEFDTYYVITKDGDVTIRCHHLMESDKCIYFLRRPKNPIDENDYDFYMLIPIDQIIKIEKANADFIAERSSRIMEEIEDFILQEGEET